MGSADFDAGHPFTQSADGWVGAACCLQVEHLKAVVEDQEFIPSALQRLVLGNTTLTTGEWGGGGSSVEGGGDQRC